MALNQVPRSAKGVVMTLLVVAGSLVVIRLAKNRFPALSNWL